MAIRIDTNDDGQKKLRERDEKNRKTALRCAKIALAAIIAGIAVTAAVNAAGIAGKISDVSALYEAAQSEFEGMQAQAAANQADIESKPDEQEAEKVDRDMYSAKKDGQRVCELLNQAYLEGGLILQEDADELRELTGSSNPFWFGETLDPAESPLQWEFLTWYDSTDGHKYKTAWGCYAPDGSGQLTYLLCAKYGNYDGEDGRFAIEGSYVTTFGEMYMSAGRIENDGDSPEASEILDIADQLAGSGDSESESQQGGTGGLSFPAAPSHSGNDGAHGDNDGDNDNDGGGEESSAESDNNGDGGETGVNEPAEAGGTLGIDLP